MGRQLSYSAGSSLDTGLQNGGYVGDNSDTNDVIMMMDTKASDTVERRSGGGRKETPSFYKVSQKVNY